MEGEGERLGRQYDSDGTGGHPGARRRSPRLGTALDRYLELEYPREHPAWVLQRARPFRRPWSLRRLIGR